MNVSCADSMPDSGAFQIRYTWFASAVVSLTSTTGADTCVASSPEKRPVKKAPISVSPTASVSTPSHCSYDLSTDVFV